MPLVSGWRILCPCCGRPVLVLPQEGGEPVVALISGPEMLGASFSGLTPRELDVLQYAARGWSNEQIGTALSITVKTVKTHVSSIIGKLGTRNRAGAVAEGIRRGLVTLVEHDENRGPR